MKKPFLLIAGHHYYPGAGTGDWIGCFSTEGEAISLIKENGYITYESYTINEREYDWYKIIDLNTWVN